MSPDASAVAAARPLVFPSFGGHDAERDAGPPAAPRRPAGPSPAELEDAARHLLAARVELAAEVERQMPRLVFALARKVLREELSHAQTAAQTVIRGVCERLAGCERPVTVRLAPEAAGAFEQWARGDEGIAAAGPGVRVETDPRLGPGDFVLETEDGFLDGRVESQLDAAWRLIAELPRP